jgi:hypothetical protein
MNRKQLVIILIVGLVVGGAGFLLNRQKSASFERTQKSATGTLLGDFPINDTTLISIRHGSNEVNLANVKGDLWTVRERADYPANASQVIEFGRKLVDLRAAQNQKIGESQLGRLNLLDPAKGSTNSATLVELKGKDGKVIRSVRLGKESMRDSGGPMGGGGWPNGRWIYLPDQPGVAYLTSESFANIEPNPEQWLDKDFVHVEKARSIDVNFPVSTNSWKVTRETETGEWKLADAKSGETLDASKVASVSNPLSAASFADVRAGTTLEGTGSNAPVVVTIDTFENFHYVAKIGGKTDDNYSMTVAVTAQLAKERVPGKDEKPEDKAKLDKEFKASQDKLEEKLKKEQAFGKWTYLVSSWGIEPLMKHRSDLMTNPSSTNSLSSTQPPQIEDPPLPLPTTPGPH